MTKRKKSVYIVAYLIVSLIFIFGGTVVKGYASQILPSGLVIGDDSGLYANSEGEFFVDLPDILPGEIYEKTITIRSLDVEEPFELGMLVKYVSKKGSIDFNQHILLTLVVDEEEIYSGPLLGDGKFDWEVQPLVLGEVDYGVDHILKASFQMDQELTADDYLEISQLLYEWTFVATKNQPIPPTTSESESGEKETIKKPEGKLPQTGEQIRNNIYKILTGIALILIVIIVWKKRKNEESTKESED